MERVTLSPGGPEVSRIAWGAWRLADHPALAGSPAEGVRAVRQIIDACLEHGITTVDHADIYGRYRSEEIFGNALREAPELREHIEVVTKCGIRLKVDAQPDVRVKHYDTTGEHITTSVERSLTKLAIDTIDVLLIHRPDPLNDPDDTADALHRLRNSGKIRHAGVSNYTPSQFDLLQSRLEFTLVTNQIEVSPLSIAPFTDGTLEHCQMHRLRPMAWSPLARGHLVTSEDDAAQRARGALQTVAAQHPGSDVNQIALAWLLRHPSGMIPIIGTGKPDRVESAVGALDLDLDRQSWFEIYEAALGCGIP